MQAGDVITVNATATLGHNGGVYHIFDTHAYGRNSWNRRIQLTPGVNKPAMPIIVQVMRLPKHEGAPTLVKLIKDSTQTLYTLSSTKVMHLDTEQRGLTNQLCSVQLSASDWVPQNGRHAHAHAQFHDLIEVGLLKQGESAVLLSIYL